MFDYRDESLKLAEAIRARMAEKPPRKIKLPKTLAVIDQSGCTGCEACIQFCPVDCIELVPGPTHPDMGKLVEVDLDRCIGCKLCAKYCPWDTIHMVVSAEAPETAKEWTLRAVIAPHPHDPTASAAVGAGALATIDPAVTAAVVTPVAAPDSGEGTPPA